MEKEKYLRYFIYTLLILYTLFTLFYNINSLNIGHDESIYLAAAKTLAEKGTYGIETNWGIIKYWQKIRVGPTLIVPVAILFKFFGFNPSLARYFNAFISLSAILLLFYISKKLFNERTAFLTVFLLLISFWLPIPDRGIYTPINRYLCGEMLAVLFLLEGAILLYMYLENNQTKSLVGSGLFFGLSALTKLHFLIASAPAVVILAIGSRKIKNLKNILLFAISSTIPLIFWLIWSSAKSTQQPLAYIKGFFNFEGKPFVFSPIKYTQNFYGIFQITPNTLEPIILFPTLLLAASKLLQDLKNKKNLAKLYFLSLIILWIGWYITSIGYPRYLEPALLLSTMFVAYTFIYFLTYKKREVRVFFIALFVLVIGPAFLFTTTQTISNKDTRWVQQIENYVYENIPEKTIIESKEFEIFQLSNKYNIHYTPVKVKNYDPKELGATYIIGGYFNGDPRFEKTLKNHNWSKIYSAGNYKILKLEE